MRIVSKASKRHERLQNWHRWFAWHPAYLGQGVSVWLETVERRGHFIGNGLDGECWQFEYRVRQPTDPTDAIQPAKGG